MKEQRTKMELLGSVLVPKVLLALGLSTMAGMLISALYNLVDSYFIGGLGTAQMGAIAMTFPLGQVVMSLGLLFGNGAAACLSHLLGRGDRQTVDKVTSIALYDNIFIGIVVIFCSVLFLRPVLRQLGAIESVIPHVVTYTSIYITFSVFNVFNVTMNNIVSNERTARAAMTVLIAGAFLGVILDPVFIYTLHLGIVGAAIVTTISQMVSTLVYLVYIFRGESAFHFRIRDCCFSGNILSEIPRIRISTLVFQLLTSLPMSMINRVAKEYGSSTLVAMGPVTKIMFMGSLMVFGSSKGSQPITGYSYGAGKLQRLHEAIRISIIWSTIFCVLLGGLAAFFFTEIMSQFTRNGMEMIRVGQTALQASDLTSVLFGFYTVYSFLFLAMGKVKEGCFLDACRQGICFMPVTPPLPGFIGLNGVLFAQPAADLLPAIVTVFLAVRPHRQLAEAGLKTVVTNLQRELG